MEDSSIASITVRPPVIDSRAPWWDLEAAAVRALPTDRRAMPRRIVGALKENQSAACIDDGDRHVQLFLIASASRPPSSPERLAARSWRWRAAAPERGAADGDRERAERRGSVLMESEREGGGLDQRCALPRDLRMRRDSSNPWWSRPGPCCCRWRSIGRRFQSRLTRLLPRRPPNDRVRRRQPDRCRHARRYRLAQRRCG